MGNDHRAPESRTAKVIQLYASSKPDGSPRSSPNRTPDRPSRRPANSDQPQQVSSSSTGEDVTSVTPISADVTPLIDSAGVPVTRTPSPLLSLQSVRSAIADSVIAGTGYMRERLTGDYPVDDYGFDQHFTEHVFMPALRVLFDKWFRVQVSGIENLPTDRGALLVANHAGTIPIDGLMLSVAVHDHHPRRRWLRPLAADLVFESPFIGQLARRTGSTLACAADAQRLLRDGELAAVWPEGFKGVGKLYRDRYKLQRFGRGGFVTTAMRTGAPIIPVSIVGSEEIYPMVTDLKPLARALGLPYIPVTPLFPLLGPLGLVPLPSKWHIHFGAPIETSGYDAHAADDPMVVFEVTDRVREDIQQTLFRMLSTRGSVYFG